MSKLVSFFLKPYDRTIETVVKADDTEHIYDEVVEYVVTNDIASKIANFFESYKDTSSTNGVWISGFFGSGKSHLLKILSYVLENKEYNNESLGQLFASKIEGDPKLKADISQCIKKYSSESILFNIDQQAQITSKTDQNALLQVFYKVFYDHQGFYGFQPHIAEFEAYLDKEGKYELFKVEFEKQFGRAWTSARIDYVDPRINDAIAVVLGTIYEVDAEKYEDYLDLWEDKHKASIEDFADKVATYIACKGKNFRLNFFVDEVGQYIAENTKLMLNLQTIAESLDTKCKGNSWVFVTSQEDLESLVGDDRQIQKDDFSKIQGRFNNRIALTSSNVDEVIEKRLLDKNQDGTALFSKLYADESANLKTLLTFSEIGMQFRMYKDEDDFVNKYPFVPYQFDLFQQCIKSLSRHNAFQGKHQSVGERSMLGVFQEVLKGIQNFKSGDLVSFDNMFQGIAGTLRTETQNSILLANNLLQHRNELAVRALKVLFLVKYFDSFKATLHNIQVLLTDSVHIKTLEFHKQLEEALNLLEEESYIQRRGDVYEYLTNEEKDVEEEIKDLRVEDGEVCKYLSEVLFDGVLTNNKIRYAENKQEFDYTRIIDDIVIGRQNDLKIAFATPDYIADSKNNESTFKMQTASDQTLLLISMPTDRRFMNEVRLYLKTYNYIRKNGGATNSDSVSRILREKGTLNSQRNAQIESKAKELVASATIYINGEVNMRSSSSDARTRIIESFQDLIKVAYTKLDLLGTADLNDEELRKILMSKAGSNLFGSNDSISLPEQEMLAYITRCKNMNNRTNLTDLRQHFSGRPYGWKMISSFCILALLFKNGKIEAKQSTNVLDDKQFENALNNNQLWSNTLIEPQQEIDSTLLRKIKDLHKDLFDNTNTATEAKEIVKNFKEQASLINSELQVLLSQTDSYPFLSIVKLFKEKLSAMVQLDYAQIINSCKDYEDKLLDFKEDHLDPIRAFMNGDQKTIFNQIKKFADKDGNVNLRYLANEADMNLLAEISTSKHPYTGGQIRLGKEALDRLEKELKDLQAAEIKLTEAKLIEAQESLKSEPEFAKLDTKQQERVLHPFNTELANIKNERYIANMQGTRAEVADLLIRQLNLCLSLAKQPEPITPITDGTRPIGDTPRPIEVKPKEVFIRLENAMAKVKTNISRIENQEDLDNYLSALKATLMEELKQDRKINLK